MRERRKPKKVFDSFFFPISHGNFFSARQLMMRLQSGFASRSVSLISVCVFYSLKRKQFSSCRKHCHSSWTPKKVSSNGMKMYVKIPKLCAILIERYVCCWAIIIHSIDSKKTNRFVKRLLGKLSLTFRRGPREGRRKKKSLPLCCQVFRQNQGVDL